MNWTFRLALAAALAASCAAAQTAPAATEDAAAPDVPAAAAWGESIRDTFFSDTGTMTLRPEADIRARWAGLSSEDQRIVDTDCKATRSGSVGGADPAATEAEATETPAGEGDDRPPLSSEATGPAGSAVAAGEISLSHLVQICALVDEMGVSGTGP